MGPSGWTVRYYRGAEPQSGGGAFSKLPPEMQQKVRALAGLIRLSRALRKSGVASASGIRTENSASAVLLKIPNLSDTAETAAQLAVGKHLLETFLEKPLVLKSVPKPGKVLALPAPTEEILRDSVASD